MGVGMSLTMTDIGSAIGIESTLTPVSYTHLDVYKRQQVVEVFRGQMNANLVYVDAVDRFLDKLAGVAEPEKMCIRDSRWRLWRLPTPRRDTTSS